MWAMLWSHIPVIQSCPMFQSHVPVENPVQQLETPQSNKDTPHLVNKAIWVQDIQVGVMATWPQDRWSTRQYGHKIFGQQGNVGIQDVWSTRQHGYTRCLVNKATWAYQMFGQQGNMGIPDVWSTRQHGYTRCLVNTATWVYKMLGQQGNMGTRHLITRQQGQKSHGHKATWPQDT